MCSMLPSSGTKCLLTSERAHSWRKGQAEAEPRPRGLFPRAASDPHCIPAAEQMARKSQGDHEDPPPPGWAGSQSFGCDFVRMETLERPLISPPQGGVNMGQPWSVYTIESR